MTMGPSVEVRRRVEDWLKHEFPDADVASQWNFDREVTLFRARDERPPGPAKELEVSDEAFENADVGVEGVLGALDRFKLADQMREHDDPSGNLWCRLGPVQPTPLQNASP